MRLKLQLLPLLGMCFLLASFTYIKKADKSSIAKTSIATTTNAPVLKVRKLNFVQRFVLKLLIKKNKLLTSGRADKLASASLTLGIIACGTVLLGLFVPFIILLSIPAGISAMITGGSAVRHQTTQIGKAKTGKGLGLGALIAFGVLLILAAILLASYFGG
ncbi:MAG: hypothetical protein ACRDE8_12350 [Ginsengibacter sp.]